MGEKRSKDEKCLEDLEIDAFDLLKGKMNDVAIDRLHKQIVSH